MASKNRERAEGIVASTYTSESVAEKAIGEVLMKNELEIKSWLEKSKNKPFSKKEFEAEISFNAGYGVKADGMKIKEMNKGVIDKKRSDRQGKKCYK